MKPILPDNEVFVLDDGDNNFYLYNPLNRAVCVVNDEVVRIAQKYLKNGFEQLPDTEIKIINDLIDIEVLTKKIPNYPIPPKDYSFLPNEVTLFLTTRCNLRCTYCYANGGNTKVDISFDACKAAIDLVSKNAISTGLTKFVVSFHGGGEPFCAWNILKQCVDYANKIAKKYSLQVEIFSATNGILSEKKRQYIIENLTAVNISADGPPDIQNSQRPLTNGKGSSKQLIETINYFEKNNFTYDIRTTVTKESSSRLSDIVSFFVETCPSIEQLHIEPAWYCGRCFHSGEQPPSSQQFIDDFIHASSLAHKYGIQLYYSGARLDSLSNRFCNAPGEGFSVTPYGNLTSCFEVIHPDDPRSELFHYGHFDKLSNKFVVDDARQTKLRSYTVENLSYCSDCFCRWHCAGDCLAKSITNNSFEHKGSERCDINRALTFDQIKRSINRVNLKEGVIHEKASK